MNSYDNIFLPVDDMATAKQYYETILGLTLKFDFSKAGMAAYAPSGEETAIILKDKKVFPDTKPTIWFEVDDVQAQYKRMCDAGITFLSEPFEVRTGYAVEFEDPFGNRLGITDYLKKSQ